jgi:hypothetical protein
VANPPDEKGERYDEEINEGEYKECSGYRIILGRKRE